MNFIIETGIIFTSQRCICICIDKIKLANYFLLLNQTMFIGLKMYLQSAAHICIKLFVFFQVCFTVLNNKGIKTQYVIDDLKQLKRDAIFNGRKIAFITNFVTISILKHH